MDITRLASELNENKEEKVIGYSEPTINVTLNEGLPGNQQIKDAITILSKTNPEAAKFYKDADWLDWYFVDGKSVYVKDLAITGDRSEGYVVEFPQNLLKLQPEALAPKLDKYWKTFFGRI